MRKILPIALLLTASAALAGDEECRYEEPRSLSSSASGVTKIVVHGVSGTLHVDGRPGVTDVRASGKACTSDKDLLRDITLTARRSGSELHIEAQTPEREARFHLFYEARLDFGVVVPQNVAIEVRDGSGSTKVTNTGTLRVKDGSGGLTIANVRGDLTVNDGSGEIEIDGVTGNVTIDDGSGEISIRNVDGEVEIDDNSGSIDVSHVKRSVLVADDGSGGVRATDVAGDFTVRSKGSGGVRYARIGGRVNVPRDRED
jgi:Putative adhesin